jgi:hypothetical protein
MPQTPTETTFQMEEAAATAALAEADDTVKLIREILDGDFGSVEKLRKVATTMGVYTDGLFQDTMDFTSYEQYGYSDSSEPKSKV